MGHTASKEFTQLSFIIDANMRSIKDEEIALVRHMVRICAKTGDSGKRQTCQTTQWKVLSPILLKTCNKPVYLIRAGRIRKKYVFRCKALLFQDGIDSFCQLIPLNCTCKILCYCCLAIHLFTSHVFTFGIGIVGHDVCTQQPNRQYPSHSNYKVVLSPGRGHDLLDPRD